MLKQSLLQSTVEIYLKAKLDENYPILKFVTELIQTAVEDTTVWIVTAQFEAHYFDRIEFKTVHLLVPGQAKPTFEHIRAEGLKCLKRTQPKSYLHAVLKSSRSETLIVPEDIIDADIEYTDETIIDQVRLTATKLLN